MMKMGEREWGEGGEMDVLYFILWRLYDMLSCFLLSFRPKLWRMSIPCLKQVINYILVSRVVTHGCGLWEGNSYHV